MNIRLVAVGLAIFFIGACGGSGGSGGSTSGDEELPFESILNGYHLVNDTGYDELGNVVSVWNFTTNYDQNSLDSTFTLFDVDGTVTFSSVFKTTYDSQGRLVREDFSSDDGSDTTTYEFNDKGLLAIATRVGDSNYSMNFVYDESDRLISRLRQWFTDGTESSVVTDTYSYNTQGLLTSAFQEENATTPDPVTGETFVRSQVTSYLYDNNDRITRRERVTVSGFGADEETEILDFTYDANGNVTEEIRTRPDGVTRHVLTYELSEEPIFNLWLRRFRYFP